MVLRSLLTYTGLSVGLLCSAQNQSWTATDINGNTHSIQNYLDQGKTVLVDISAYWCGPCWAWHKSHIMNKLWDEFGPEGTDDLVILWVDGDASTSLNLLNGVGSGTQGNWVEGTPFPIIGPGGQGSTLANIYDIEAYPTLFLHCPGGQSGVEIDREATWDEFLESWTNACPAAFANGVNDATILEPDVRKVCPDGNPDVLLRNQGSAPLTSATLTISADGSEIQTVQWTGNLAQNSHESVVFDQAHVSGTSTFDVVVSNPNGQSDDHTPGDDQITDFVAGPDGPLAVTLKLRTDQYPAETTWKLFDDAGAVVAQDPPGNYAANTVYSYDWSLDPSRCYTFVISDQYGDGICCTYGQGYYRLQDTYSGNIFLQGAQFGATGREPWRTANNVSVEERAGENGLALYPNPTTGLLNLGLDLPGVDRVALDVFNVLGERVKTAVFPTGGGAQTRTIDLADLNNGIYYVTLSGPDDLKITRKVSLCK